MLRCSYTNPAALSDCSSHPFQIARLKQISQEPDIYEKLMRSVAPSIWELDDIKKGLLCQVRHQFPSLPQLLFNICSKGKTLHRVRIVTD